MTDDEVDEIVRVVEVYLSGRLGAADWRLWLRHRQQAERAVVSGRRARRSSTSAIAGESEGTSPIFGVAPSVVLKSGAVPSKLSRPECGTVAGS
jgi:hypothetical protein